MNRNQTLSQNAIQQSSDFIDLGKKEYALEILFEAIRVRRGKAWNSSIEEAMTNFLSLSLSIISIQGFKDGSNQYRILCQMTNVNSFDKVMSKFFDDCLISCKKALDESREKLLAEDLDCLETPETVMLKSVSETTYRERTDRSLLTPTLKFVWEAFKNTLENCKNNRNLEKVYADVAKKAFKFLVEFERKTEFRKICDLTRSHLLNIVRYTQNTLSIVLSEPTSLELQLELRLAQLDTALSMELWSEAFKTMADIHYLLKTSQRAPHPKILAIFYQKISIVFSRANAPLFHAIALQKLFILIKEHKKGFKMDELMRISSRVLIATLSIPLSFENSEFSSVLSRFNDTASNSNQLASILGLTSVPSRSSVINDMIKISISQYADPTLLTIFEAFEGKGYTSSLCSFISQQILNLPPSLMEELSSYVESIHQVAFLTFFNRISTFYKCISLSRLSKFSCNFNESQVLSLVLSFRQTGMVDFVYDGESKILYFSPGKSRLCNIHGVLSSEMLKSIFKNISDPIFELSHPFASEELSDLIDIYRNHPTSENERHIRLKDESDKYMETVLQEQEEMNRQLSAHMEEERLRLDKLQLARMEEEKRRRDEKRMLEQSGQAYSYSNQVDLPSNIRPISAINEQKDREITSHVKKLKKLEKYVDAFYISFKNLESKRLSEYLLKTAELQLKRWQKRDSDLRTAIEQQKKREMEIKTRLLKADEDINDFLKVANVRAMKIHLQLKEEYNQLLEKERVSVLEKVRANYIKKRKEDYVAKLKEEFLKKQNANKNIQSSQSDGKKFQITRRQTSKATEEKPKPIPTPTPIPSPATKKFVPKARKDHGLS